MWVLSAGAWGALGFFVGAFLEEIALPLPSPLLLIGVAFFVGKPLLSVVILSKILFMVILPITVGATLGSFLVYILAYYGGKSAIDRWGKRWGVTWDEVEKFRAKMSKTRSDEMVLFLSRCLPFTPTTLLTIIAGIVRMNPWVYVVLTFLGILVRVTALFAGSLIFSSAIFR